MDDLVLSLTTAAGQLTTTLNGRPLAQTPRATLSPTSAAEAFLAALGGVDLYEKSSRSADQLLWLALPPRAPWPVASRPRD